MCCDSAHKTLPVLTGGAYLHVSKNAPREFTDNARAMLSVFASTSPSYLILASLDKCCDYLADGYEDKLSGFAKELEQTVEKIKSAGFDASLSEPLKIVINAAASGYTGEELGDALRDSKIEPEFCDREFLVLMVTPENSEGDLRALTEALGKIKPKAPLLLTHPRIAPSTAAVSIREAIFSKQERVSSVDAIGRVCASPTVSCPPAVPIAVSGELITEETAKALIYYGIDHISVIK